MCPNQGLKWTRKSSEPRLISSDARGQGMIVFILFLFAGLGLVNSSPKIWLPSVPTSFCRLITFERSRVCCSATTGVIWKLDLCCGSREYPKPPIKGSKICTISPVMYSDTMFMGLVNHIFSLGGKNLVMTQLNNNYLKKNKKSLRILKNTN